MLAMLKYIAENTPERRMVESFLLRGYPNRTRFRWNPGYAQGPFTRRLFGWADALFVDLLAWLALDVGFFHEPRTPDNLVEAS